MEHNIKTTSGTATKNVNSYILSSQMLTNVVGEKHIDQSSASRIPVTKPDAKPSTMITTKADNERLVVKNNPATLQTLIAHETLDDSLSQAAISPFVESKNPASLNPFDEDDYPAEYNPFENDEENV